MNIGDIVKNRADETSFYVVVDISDNEIIVKDSQEYLRANLDDVIIVPDCYKTLEAKPYFLFEDIKKQYRKLAKKYHPDINKDIGAVDKFKEIQSAYDLLNNQELKRKYDYLYLNKEEIVNEYNLKYKNNSSNENNYQEEIEQTRKESYVTKTGKSKRNYHNEYYYDEKDDEEYRLYKKNHQYGGGGRFLRIFLSTVISLILGYYFSSMLAGYFEGHYDSGLVYYFYVYLGIAITTIITFIVIFAKKKKTKHIDFFLVFIPISIVILAALIPMMLASNGIIH